MIGRRWRRYRTRGDDPRPADRRCDRGLRGPGLRGRRVQDIARAAGLTTGAIYANYRDKGELLFDAIGTRAGVEVDACSPRRGGRDARATSSSSSARCCRNGAATVRRCCSTRSLRRGATPSWPRCCARRLGVREEHLVELLDAGQGRRRRHRRSRSRRDRARFCTDARDGCARVAHVSMSSRPNTNDWQALIHRVVGAFAPDDRREGR